MTVVYRNCMMLAVVSAVAGGQGRTPPTPPAPPAPPSPPSAPVPASARRAYRLDRDAIRDIDGLRLLDLDRVRAQTDEIRARSADMAREALEASRVITREQIDAARDVSRQALEASRLVAPQALMAARDALGQLQVTAPLAQLNDGLYALSQTAGSWNGPRITGPSFQNDPADSLFKRARDLLNSGDQRAAAQRFKELQTKYPSSQYFASAMYYQAFSLYRAGTEAELREGLAVLEKFKEKYPNARLTGENGYPADADNLMGRIRGNLAERGDANARRQLDQAAGGSSPACDRDNLSVQAEALSALMRIDPAAATPKLEQILARREECTLSLRQSALSILSRRNDDKSVSILLATAKSDPSTQMRRDAVSYIARFPNDEVLTTLESIAKNEQNDQIRRQAASSLVGYPSPRARTIVRTIVEDNTMSDDMRCDVLNRFTEERGSVEDATWLRASFPKTTSQRVKSCLVSAIGRVGGAESQKWLMDLAIDENESSTIRNAAFRRVSTNMNVAELGRLYDNAGNRPMRQTVVTMLNQRKEPDALDKLIDILKKSTDVEIKLQVIRLLSDRQNDPKAKQALVDAIGK